MQLEASVAAGENAAVLVATGADIVVAVVARATGATSASVCIDAAGVGSAAVVAGRRFARSWALAKVLKGATTFAADHVSAPSLLNLSYKCCAFLICKPASCQHMSHCWAPRSCPSRPSS